MRLSRNLLIPAVAFSAVWHFMWMSAVNIVVAKETSAYRTFGEIVFLGPILEKSSVDTPLESKRPRGETMFKTRSIKEAESRLELGDKVYSRAEGVPRSGLDMGPAEVLKFIPEEKSVPEKFMGEKGFFYLPGGHELNRFIEGPAKLRGMISRPAPPALLKNASRDEDVYQCRLKFTVTEGGNVDYVEVAQSSGDPEVDMACVANLRQWRFVPVSSVQGNEKDWGIVSFTARTR